MVSDDTEKSIFAKLSRKPLGIESISSLGFKYNPLRDHPLHTTDIWLEAKRAEDGADGLWRIHDGLYDFKDFIKDHPGGSDWLNFTKGTDITEAFEAHHISTMPETLLPKFYIRKASFPRNSPFTFKPDGFYRTLKENIRIVMQSVPKTPATKSKVMTDALFLSYIVSAILAAREQSLVLGAISGVVLSCLAIASHNFFHQRDNFRMYYFDFSMMSARDWRISHVLSHHLYTNTINDLEISVLEPFFQYLPTDKHFIFQYMSWLYSPFLYSGIFVVTYTKLILSGILYGRTLNLTLLLPFSVVILMYFLGENTVLNTVLMFAWIITIGSIHFGLVGVNAAHHHPDIFHDGDTPRSKREMDWGIYQMDAVMDRKDINGSDFLVLTNFGNHSLHHLFPAIDHGLLPFLYPEFKKTCEQFGVEFRVTSQIELIKGQFRQLAKVLPKREPPGERASKEVKMEPILSEINNRPNNG